jgi:hypothetical protein
MENAAIKKERASALENVEDLERDLRQETSDIERAAMKKVSRHKLGTEFVDYLRMKWELPFHEKIADLEKAEMEAKLTWAMKYVGSSESEIRRAISRRDLGFAEARDERKTCFF